MLEIALQRLRSFGVNEVIINTHHFADLVRDYLDARRNFGMRIEISPEDILLDTGGGLKKAAWFFLEGGRDEPFLLHNVDVISNIDLSRMVRFHTEQGALVTLAVQARPTSRPLLFNQGGWFRGRAGQGSSTNNPGMVSLAFSGIHVISPRLFAHIAEEGVFSLIDSYVRLASQGHKILAFPADSYYWRDVGRPADLNQAAADLNSGDFKV